MARKNELEAAKRKLRLCQLSLGNLIDQSLELNKRIAEWKIRVYKQCQEVDRLTASSKEQP